MKYLFILLLLLACINGQGQTTDPKKAMNVKEWHRFQDTGTTTLDSGIWKSYLSLSGGDHLARSLIVTVADSSLKKLAEVDSNHVIHIYDTVQTLLTIFRQYDRLARFDTVNRFWSGDGKWETISPKKNKSK